MNLKEILKDQALAEMQEISSIDPSKLSPAEQFRIAAKWYRQGIIVKDIAAIFNISVSTVYEWMKKDKEHVLFQLEQKTGLEIIVDQLDDLENLEQLCMYEASHLGADQVSVDSSGKPRVTAPSQKALDSKARFIKLALDCRKMRIDLYQQSGIIPKIAEKIYTTVKDNKVIVDEKAENLNHSALTETVLDKLKNNRNL